MPKATSTPPADASPLLPPGCLRAGLIVCVKMNHRILIGPGYFRCSAYLRVHLRILTRMPRLADTAISAPLLRGSVRQGGYQVVTSSPRGIFFSTS